MGLFLKFTDKQTPSSFLLTLGHHFLKFPRTLSMLPVSGVDLELPFAKGEADGLMICRP